MVDEQICCIEEFLIWLSGEIGADWIVALPWSEPEES